MKNFEKLSCQSTLLRTLLKPHSKHRLRRALVLSQFGRLSRTPASTRSPTPPGEQPSDASTSCATTTTTTTALAASRDDSSSDKRKRTVHIDVYCTGTEDEPLDDSSSADSDDNLTQTTVFESSAVLVRHTPAACGSLPRGFQDEGAFLRRAGERRCESFRQGLARLPSLSSSRGYESDEALSSLYPSQPSSCSRLRDLEAWSAASSSAGLADESASWRDTVSDLESLARSGTSVAPSDSFDYADSLDRQRIRRLELAGRRLLRAPARWSSERSSEHSSDSDDSEEEFGWSFVSSEEGSSVVRGRLVLTPLQAPPPPPAAAVPPRSIFRDRIGPFGSSSPSPTPSKLQSRMTSPFTTPQGERTDHILKASIFGRVVSTFRKPGHHVGPAKNPACSCEHCRRHFEEIRTRSRSLEPRRSDIRTPEPTAPLARGD